MLNKKDWFYSNRIAYCFNNNWSDSSFIYTVINGNLNRKQQMVTQLKSTITAIQTF